MRSLVRIIRDEEGGTSVEYAVMLAMILIAVIGAVGSLGSETGGMWGGIEDNLEDVGFIQGSGNP
jgi:pilus assembly protein Flp/PilA